MSELSSINSLAEAAHDAIEIETMFIRLDTQSDAFKVTNELNPIILRQHRIADHHRACFPPPLRRSLCLLFFAAVRSFDNVSARIKLIGFNDTIVRRE